ncbi:MAG: viroplasmin family protein [Oleispira antarctica]|nr:viroplasmin family protein [Oleispira antarctica]MBQ0792877.1 viroplasmin family protein [Oleispira antarctica]|tara:strand:+ start:2389 stop:3162 length:774 start_codon:yes stop_codon:yes gene_type:complete
MAKKFYVIWVGREPGIYTDWPTAQKQIMKFSGAKYKSFPTKAEADAAFSGGSVSSAAGAGSKPRGSSSKTSRGNNLSAPPIKTDVVIYCDGGCDPNPGKAGSGVAVYQDDQLIQLWYGVYNPNGTNNTAELSALFYSLQLAQHATKQGLSAQILCDSMYSIQCIRDWAAGWEKNGWKKKTGEIKNLDIIKQAYALYNEIKETVLLSHVKAHAGTEGNELADRMTMVAVERKDPAWVQYEQDSNNGFNIPALLKMRAG